MKALNKLKQNGFLESIERIGYYVTKNPYSYFFYSISDFYNAKQIKTTKVANFKLPSDVLKLIKINAKDFSSFAKLSTITFKREYYDTRDFEKAAYFIFQKKMIAKINDPNLLKNKPLYEFLALNGYIAAKNIRFAFFSDQPFIKKNANKRCWVVVEFVYDINNDPLAILFINYFDHNTNHILYKRNSGIYK